MPDLHLSVLKVIPLAPEKFQHLLCILITTLTMNPMLITMIVRCLTSNLPNSQFQFFLISITCLTFPSKQLYLENMVTSFRVFCHEIAKFIIHFFIDFGDFLYFYNQILSFLIVPFLQMLKQDQFQG